MNEKCVFCDKHLYKEIRADRKTYFVGVSQLDKQTSVLRIVPTNGEPPFVLPIAHCPVCGKLISADPIRNYEDLIAREG